MLLKTLIHQEQIEVSEAANTNDLIKQLSTTSESIKYKPNNYNN